MNDISRPQVLLIGGPEPIVFGPFKKRLEEKGFGLLSHVPSHKRKIEGIPSDVSLVIVITNYVNHALSKSAVAAAKDAGVPVVQCSQKWSLAWPLIKQVADGAGIPYVEQLEKPTRTPDDAYIRRDQDRQAQEYARLIIEDRPALAANPLALEEALREVLEDDELPPQDPLTSLILKVSEMVRTGWAATRGGRNGDRLLALKKRWLRQWAEERAARGAKFPTTRAAAQACKELFGSGIYQKNWREVRDEVLKVEQEPLPEDKPPEKPKKLSRPVRSRRGRFHRREGGMPDSLSLEDVWESLQAIHRRLSEMPTKGLDCGAVGGVVKAQRLKSQEWLEKELDDLYNDLVKAIGEKPGKPVPNEAPLDDPLDLTIRQLHEAGYKVTISIGD